MIKNKKFLVTFFIILLSFIIFKLGWYVNVEKEFDHYDVSRLVPSYFNATENNLIYLTALKDNYSYRSKYIKVELTNDSDHQIIYGKMYQLETFIDDKWYKVPMKENHSFPLMTINLDAHCSITLNVLLDDFQCLPGKHRIIPVSYTHLRAHETRHDLVCRLLLE